MIEEEEKTNIQWETGESIKREVDIFTLDAGDFRLSVCVSVLSACLLGAGTEANWPGRGIWDTSLLKICTKKEKTCICGTLTLMREKEITSVLFFSLWGLCQHLHCLYTHTFTCLSINDSFWKYDRSSTSFCLVFVFSPDFFLNHSLFSPFHFHEVSNRSVLCVFLKFVFPLFFFIFSLILWHFLICFSDVWGSGT